MSTIDTSRILVHVIDQDTNTKIHQTMVNHAPRTGEEVRLGGVGKEKFYTVRRVVWVYDEPECPCGRVNIGVTLS